VPERGTGIHGREQCRGAIGVANSCRCSIMHGIIGLGNPGPEYGETRHNVGFRVVDLLAERHGIRLRRRRLRSEVGQGEIASQRVLLEKPQTFMNNSGEAAAQVVSYFDLQPQDLLIIYDDLDLELGTLRLRRGGSAGTHKGMRSVVAHLDTDEIPRLRLGIGPLPAEADAVEFVLSAFRGAEIATVEEMLTRAAEAVEYYLTEGIEAAMNKFNPSPDSLPPQEGDAHTSENSAV